jgi:transcriptional regulator with XRE-family HTH domain
MDVYEDYLEYFSNRLFKLRSNKGVSAREMSLSMGQGHGYIGQLERKAYLPSMTGFFYICEYLDIKPKDFFDDEIEQPVIFSEIITNMKELGDEQLRTVNDLVKGLAKK